MPSSAAERQKRYRERMKNENPTKFKQMQRNNADRTNRKRKRIADFEPEERVELRRQWREKRNKINLKKTYYNLNSQAAPPAPEWVQDIEERRIAVEERSARALQGIHANTEFCVSALQGIQYSQECLNKTMQGIQAALEASARALQERRN